MSKTAIIILLYFIVSAIGGAISRRQKQAQKERQRQRGRRDLESASSDPMIEEVSARDPAARPARQSPEEIAAEIRRVMGLEREESRVEVLEEVYEPPVRSSDRGSSAGGGERPDWEFDPAPQPVKPRASLHDEMQARDRAVARAPGNLEARHLQSAIGARGASTAALGALTGRYGTRAIGQDLRRPAGRSYVDLSDMARALVTMEVLGKPKALRDDEW